MDFDILKCQNSAEIQKVFEGEQALVKMIENLNTLRLSMKRNSFIFVKTFKARAKKSFRAREVRKYDFMQRFATGL